MYIKKKITISLLSIQLAVSAFAQTTPVQEVLQKQFDNYRQNTLQEKIFVHTDKNFYLSGEICWFKIYDVDAYFHKPLDVSKVAYVEVLDKNNKPVLQAKVSLQKGNGNGSLYIPVTLTSGKYKFRAYSNWMKNFGADYFFEKTITVINGTKVYDATGQTPATKYDIGFFPEGGNLVNEIQSKIGFRAVDQNGKGIAFEATVVNEKNDTITKFTPFQFGIGNFSFTPENGHSYKAILRLPGGSELVKDLPTAFSKGYVMQVSEYGTAQLKISVKANLENGTSSEIYLFAHTRSSIKAALSGNVNSGSAEFIIDKNKLGDGISHFTVFNSNRQPVCERLYFKYPEQKLDIQASTDQPEYGLRKKININVSTGASNVKSEGASLSMAVYRLNPLQEIDENDISSYLWLNSDIAGNIESPGYYFKNNSDSVKTAMENLMLTHGWRRFRWEDILNNTLPAFSFVPEFNGPIINGKLTTTSNNPHIENTKTFLSVPGTRTLFRTAVSDEKGRVHYEMKNFYGDGEIIIQTDKDQDSLARVEIENPFFNKYSDKPLPAFSMPGDHAAPLLQQNIAVQVQNIYSGDILKQMSLPDIDTSTFYGKPDESYTLDNFVRFTTMEEVLREYVTSVNVKRRDGKFHLPVFNAVAITPFQSDPMLLLDGVPIFDFNKFMEYDPLKVRRLDVVSRTYYLGKLSFEGLVNFITYNGDLSGYVLDPHAVAIDYPGMQLQRDFFSPVYETQQEISSHMPDYRNLLYWSPEVKPTTQGKPGAVFYSSDVPGKYAVVIQGLSAEGKTGSKVIEFEVKE